MIIYYEPSSNFVVNISTIPVGLRDTLHSINLPNVTSLDPLVTYQIINGALVVVSQDALTLMEQTESVRLIRNQLLSASDSLMSLTDVLNAIQLNDLKTWRQGLRDAPATLPSILSNTSFRFLPAIPVNTATVIQNIGGISLLLQAFIKYKKSNL